MKAEHLGLVPRAGQVLFCAVCVATSATIAYATAPAVPLGILLAICASACGLVCSSFKILVYFFSRKINKTLPGFIDLIVSMFIAASLLSAGIKVAAVGTCYAKNGTAVIMPRDAVSAAADQATAPPSPPLPTLSVGLGGNHGAVAAAQTNPPTQLNHLVKATAQGAQAKDVAIEAAADVAVASTAPLGRRMLRYRVGSKLFVGVFSSSGDWRSSSSDGRSPASVRRMLSSALYVPLRSHSTMICPCWDATVTLCFLNFLLYSISSAVACLDIRLGKGIVVINKHALIGKLFDQHSDSGSVHGEAPGNRMPGSTRSDSEFGDADVDIIIVPVEQLATLPMRAPRGSSSDVQS